MRTHLRRNIAGNHALARGIIAILLLASCDSKQSPPPASTAQPIQQFAEIGPIRLTVTADRNQISVGENFQLTIEAKARNGVEVEMPRFENQIAEFEVVEAQLAPDIPGGSSRLWKHQYTLRTLEAGDQQIPAVTVKFVDHIASTAGATSPVESQVSTDPLIIHVGSLLSAEFDPEKFRDIKNEVIIPLPWEYQPWLIGAGAIVLVAGAIATWAFVRKRGSVAAPPAPPLAPHVWARQQLDQLAAERLIERGEHYEYFFRLSGIVRHYIERRFNIHAAELTTEEFLRVSQGNATLTQSHRALLRDFLMQADMVKFARFQPPQPDSEAALSAARRFVHDTTPEPVASEAVHRVEVST